MSQKKFRSHRRIRIPGNIIVPIKRSKISKHKERPITHEFNISETDKVRYVYSRSRDNLVSEIISVAYDTYLNNEWVTVIYYDSVHGPMHRHEIISFENRSKITTEENVKKSGSKRERLTWAIKDIQRRCIYYKTKFLKRSNLRLTNSED